MAQASDSRRSPVCFKPLSEYQPPPLPTRDTIQIVTTRARELLQRRPAEPMVADARLKRSTPDKLDAAAAPPAHGSLIDELQATLGDWSGQNDPAERQRVIVVPPGDREDTLARWAERYGHVVVEAPERDTIVDSVAADLPSFPEHGVIVIPALERWLLRHRRGLGLIRALLDRLDCLDRHIVIGCNSWAWRYLSRAVQIDRRLAAPLIFEPFDAKRLESWFARIVEWPHADTLCFRDAENGERIISDADKTHDKLISLAARSRGIPWVAWHLWRSSLRRRIPDDDDKADKAVSETTARRYDDRPADESHDGDDGHTLWVTSVDEFSLPAGDEGSLMILHALLIHGSLTPDWLDAIVPFTGHDNAITTLRSAGLIEYRAGRFLSCVPAAYPAIRTGLSTAGFPVAAV